MPSRPAFLAKSWIVVLWLGPVVATAADLPPERLSIEPPGTVLDGRRATAQLIATGYYQGGAERDLTHEVSWTSADPSIVTVHPGGQIEPRGDGETLVRARFGARNRRR